VERLWTIISGVSVRTKILGMVLALVLLLGLVVTLQVRAMLLRTMTDQLQQQSVSLARDVAARSADPILINDLYNLNRLLRATKNNNPDVRYAFVLDTQGHVLAHTFEGGFPTALAAANVAHAADHHRAVLLTTNEGPVWDTAVPVLEGKAGVARIGVSEARMQATVGAVTTQLLLTTVLVSVVGIATATFLTWLLTRPIRTLVQATEAVRRGDLSPRVARWADDEIGELATAFNAMTADLARAAQERAEREQMRASFLERIIGAQEDERKRIARELHDEMGQSLTSLLVGLKMIAESASLDDAQGRAQDLKALTGSVLDDVRDLARELRPSVLDDMGLVAALERYTREYAQRFTLAVDLQTVGLDGLRLPARYETALYRIIQEALTNIARYAGAENVSVLLERRPESVVAIVEDDGCGFEVEQALRERRDGQNLGLLGMRERVELLGGKLTIESALGAGTTVFAQLPVDTGYTP
jgi:signal transduction histidine kinase